jgi:hypothetical protein
MGLALDEPGRDDEKVETEGFSFVLSPRVADAIRTYGGLSIDYRDRPSFLRGFEFSPAGASC